MKVAIVLLSVLCCALALPSATCDKAASNAEHLASCGCPYVWGGTECGCGGSGGLDCSGIVYNSFHAAGWNGIARVADAQCAQGSSCGSCRPDNTASCHTGDLFCYNFGAANASVGEIDHVVMYIGGGRAAECPHTGLDCRVITPYMEAYVSCARFC